MYIDGDKLSNNKNYREQMDCIFRKEVYKKKLLSKAGIAGRIVAKLSGRLNIVEIVLNKIVELKIALDTLIIQS